MQGKIKTGTDILDKNRFLESYKNGGPAFLEKIFTPFEMRENSPEQLASIFCLKEAVVKALELPNSSWLSISTRRKSNGKVLASLVDKNIARKISSLDTSISHEGNLVLAICAVIVEN